LVTVAVTVGVTPAGVHGGAVHMTRLVVGAFCAVASEPTLALQANVKVLDWESMAMTSKATVCSGEMEVADW
jgi:hypothetical protein